MKMIRRIIYAMRKYVAKYASDSIFGRTVYGSSKIRKKVFDTSIFEKTVYNKRYKSNIICDLLKRFQK